jgi:hypothetical protein
MNARLAAMVLVGAVTVAGVNGDGRFAWAQAATEATSGIPAIPAEARRVTTLADNARFRPGINAFVAGHIASLLGSDPAARSASRDALIRALPGDSSVVYAQAYASALNSALAPALASAGAVERLNAAICVASVADRASNTSLAGVTRALLKDPSDAVVLWAMKAAAPQVPVLALDTRDPNYALIREVEQVARARGGNNAWIIDEAYNALNLSKAGPNVNSDQVAAVLEPLGQLLQHRIGLYANGVPPVPVTDGKATTFLTSSRAWPVMNPAQKLAVVQQMADLLNLASNQFANQASERANLAPLINLVAKAFWVVGASIGAAPIQQATVPVTQVNQGTTPKQVTDSVAAMLEATKAIPLFAPLRTSLPQPGAPAATQPTAAVTARGAE